MANQKQKRHQDEKSDASTKSSKKQKVNHQSKQAPSSSSGTEITFNVDKSNDKLEAPLLTTYPSGVNVPGDLQLLHYKKQTNQNSQFLYGETDSLCFFAQRTFNRKDEEEEDDEDAEVDIDENGVAIEKVQTRFALGVYDPETNTVKVTPLEKVFRMKQKLLESLTNDDDDSDVEKTMKASDYVADFGNARAKKSLRSNERYNLNKTNLLEKALSSTGKKNVGYRPKYPEYFPVANKSAAMAKDIFPLNELLSEALIEDLNKVDIDVDFLTFTQGRKIPKKVAMEKIPTVVHELLQFNADFFKSDIDLQLTRRALYLSYLIWMYNAPTRFSSNALKDALQGKLDDSSHNEFKKVKLVVPNKRIANHLVSMFTTKAGDKHVAKSKENTDKLLAHIILMYAHVRNFVIRFDCLHTDLKIPEDAIEPVVKILGFERDATVTNEDGVTTATWKLRSKKYEKALTAEQQRNQQKSK